ncbi:hypothetical protein QCA50_016542 [Cerrena zonata]|uniref:Uncharacterized protein n=1 Tax=Cerrena zonata TaxID=2478898 RepID=A0AAW0FJA0_9APHY
MGRCDGGRRTHRQSQGFNKSEGRTQITISSYRAQEHFPSLPSPAAIAAIANFHLLSKQNGVIQLMPIFPTPSRANHSSQIGRIHHPTRHSPADPLLDRLRSSSVLHSFVSSSMSP